MPRPEIGGNNSESPARLAPARTGLQLSQPANHLADKTLAGSHNHDISGSHAYGRLQDNPADAGSATVDELVPRTEQPRSNVDRFEAIGALAESHDAMAELTLVGLLYDKDPAIREAAVESLHALGTEGAIQGLGFALTDTNPLIRRTAVEFLVDIGTPDALRTLVVTLGDPDVKLRLATVYELGDSNNEATSALLQEFLSDQDPTVRQVATEFLNDRSH